MYRARRLGMVCRATGARPGSGGAPNLRLAAPATAHLVLCPVLHTTPQQPGHHTLCRAVAAAPQPALLRPHGWLPHHRQQHLSTHTTALAAYSSSASITSAPLTTPPAVVLVGRRQLSTAAAVQEQPDGAPPPPQKPKKRGRPRKTPQASPGPPKKLGRPRKASAAAAARAAKGKAAGAGSGAPVAPAATAAAKGAAAKRTAAAKRSTTSKRSAAAKHAAAASGTAATITQPLRTTTQPLRTNSQLRRLNKPSYLRAFLARNAEFYRQSQAAAEALAALASELVARRPPPAHAGGGEHQGSAPASGDLAGAQEGAGLPSREVVDAVMFGVMPGSIKNLMTLLRRSAVTTGPFSEGVLRTKLAAALLSHDQSAGQVDVLPVLLTYILGDTPEAAAAAAAEAAAKYAESAKVKAAEKEQESHSEASAAAASATPASSSKASSAQAPAEREQPYACLDDVLRRWRPALDAAAALEGAGGVEEEEAPPPFPPLAARNEGRAPPPAALLLELRRWVGVYTFGHPAHDIPLEAVARGGGGGGKGGGGVSGGVSEENVAAAARARLAAARLAARLPPTIHSQLVTYLLDVALSSPRPRTQMAAHLESLLGAHAWHALPEVCAALALPPTSRAARDRGEGWVREGAAAAACTREAVRSHLHTLRKRVALERTVLSAPYNLEVLEGLSREEHLSANEAMVRQMLGSIGEGGSGAASASLSSTGGAARGPAPRSGYMRLQAVEREPIPLPPLPSAATTAAAGAGAARGSSGWRLELSEEEEQALAQLPLEEGEEAEPAADTVQVHEEEGTPWEGTSDSLTTFRDPQSEEEMEALSERERAIFVSNLPPGVTEMEIRDMLAPCGDIASIQLYKPAAAADAYLREAMALRRQKSRHAHTPLAADGGGAEEGAGGVAGTAAADGEAMAAAMAALQGPSRASARRLGTVEEVRQLETLHTRSPVHARVVFGSADAYARATHASLRVFGVHARGHMCRVTPAHRRPFLFVDTDEVADAVDAAAAASADSATTTDAPAADATDTPPAAEGGAAARAAVARLLSPHFDVDYKFGIHPAADAPQPACVRVDFTTHAAARVAEAALRAHRIHPYWFQRPGGRHHRPHVSKYQVAMSLRPPDVASLTLRGAAAGLLDTVDHNANMAGEEHLIK